MFWKSDPTAAFRFSSYCCKRHFHTGEGASFSAALYEEEDLFYNWKQRLRRRSL